MSNESSRCVRDLLRVALDLLDDEESLVAAAMISGAIEVLERRTVTAHLRSVSPIRLRMATLADGRSSRSCA